MKKGRNGKKTKIGTAISFVILLLIIIAAVAAALNWDTLKRTPAAKKVEGAFGISRQNTEASFSFDMYSDNVFAQLDGGLILASSAHIQSFDGDGELIFSKSTGEDGAVISTGGRYAAVWSVGGESIELICEGKSTQLKYQEGSDTAHPLVSVKVNGDGKTTAVTVENGYKGAVSVYGSDGSAIYRVYLGSGYPLDAALSPDGRELTVLTMTENGSRVAAYSLDSENEKNAWESDELFFALDYISSGTVCALSSESAVFLSDTLRGSAAYDFGGEYIKDFVLGGDGYALLLLGKYKVGGSGHIVTLDTGASVLGSIEDRSEPQGFSASGKNIAVLYSDEIVLYDQRLVQTGSIPDADGIKYALARSDGSVIMVSGNGASISRP